jgi:DNA topoisomerase-1
MKVVIVESPAKAKTINKYLGKDYDVYASFGHVRDLVEKDGSVDPDNDFAMRWEVNERSEKRLKEIGRAVKGADRIILATDPDREGEAISWHLNEILKQNKLIGDKRVDRVVFNAITKEAVQEAMRNPRQIDQALVDAYLARRALDYLVGFNLSPVLWRKLPSARSAGRVQSVALRIVCDRELEIEKFVPREYWSIVAHLKTPANAGFTARLIGADGKKIGRLDVGSGDEARAFEAALGAARFAVASVEAKPVKRHPQPPFTTSTLQQEASRKFGFAPARTMQIAQRLYEGVDIGDGPVGLITYMRTDGVDLAPEAVTAARKMIGREFGDAYVPTAARKYTAKTKNAQEAHEAIRPTDVTRRPGDVERHLQDDQFKLYDLIWKRTVACQMESAELERTTVDIVADAGARKLDFRATGQVVRFPGFLALYQEGRDEADSSRPAADAQGEAEEDSARLPPMKAGDRLAKERIETTQHFTEPPPRYSESSLIKRMEELGIGRPSTYASTLAVLRDREYVRLDKKKLFPEDKGRLVTAFLEAFFGKYVEYDFTADLEERLDKVSNSEIDWKTLLRDFWRDFSASLVDIKDLRTTQVLDSLNEVLGPHIFPARAEGGDPRLCPLCGRGQLSLKLGKHGAFIGCNNYPECKFTRVMSPTGQDGAEGERPGVRVLGDDPESGEPVTLRKGRFGEYVQLGEGEKPKRSSLPKGLRPDEVTLEKALKLLALPREVARHPISGEPILAGIGQYGAYVKHEKTYANLGKDDDVLEIGGNRAIDLIVAKESGASARFGAGASRVIGDHPEGGAISVKSGRFGPYINHGKVNATLPKGSNPDEVTLEQALEALKDKAAGVVPGGRLLGEHPEGGAINVLGGRFGPYVKWGKVNATIPKSRSPDTITLADAVELIAEREGRPANPARKAPAPKKAVKKAAAKPTAAKPAAKPQAKAAAAKPRAKGRGAA